MTLFAHDAGGLDLRPLMASGYLRTYLRGFFQGSAVSYSPNIPLDLGQDVNPFKDHRDRRGREKREGVTEQEGTKAEPHPVFSLPRIMG